MAQYKPKTTKADKLAKQAEQAGKGRASKPRRLIPDRKAISEIITKIGAKEETPLIEKELGRELRNKPKTPNRRKRAIKDVGKMAVELLRDRKPRRGKMGGGKVHSSKYTSGNKRYANGGKIYPIVGK